MPLNNGSGNNDFWLALIAVVSSMLYAIKNYDEFAQHSKWVRLRKLLYGMFGSALTTWAVFEVLRYVELPERLSLALAATCGYLGAEVISRIVLNFIENKITGSKKMQE